jgi:four helix bundle protein
MTYELLSNRTFELSNRMMDLYGVLLKNNEMELSARLLKYGLSIRKHSETAWASTTQMDFTEAISTASEMAIQTRYWLKLIQMKHPLSKECDESVELLNNVINMLNYIINHNEQYHFQLQYQSN